MFQIWNNKFWLRVATDRKRFVLVEVTRNYIEHEKGCVYSSFGFRFPTLLQIRKVRDYFSFFRKRYTGGFLLVCVSPGQFGEEVSCDTEERFVCDRFQTCLVLRTVTSLFRTRESQSKRSLICGPDVIGVMTM